MPFKGLTWSIIAALGILAAALGTGIPLRAAAQAVSYPWCTQGSAIHCYYSTHEQCEEAVDYHGFCIANPDLQSQDSRAPWRTRQ